ncbi:MAG TPA: C39 family peptidase [Candidatus Kurthia intestinigallinarum]|nr:C39 family peptidase [Candidatus Kurthia intestinigallinarum]
MAEKQWMPIAAALGLAAVSYQFKTRQKKALYTKEETKLKSVPYEGTKLANIPAYTLLQATNYEGAHYYVTYGNFVGWVAKVDVADAPKGYQYTALNVPYISQYRPLDAPFGCEGTSLLMALRYKGYNDDVSLKTILDNMPKADRNPNIGFVGSPYYAMEGYFQTIFPKPLTSYAREAYSKMIVDISGASPKQLQQELAHENPVVVWVTFRFEPPREEKWDIGKKHPATFVSNLHVMLLTGYNSVTQKYRVHDPADEKEIYWVPKEQFEAAYLARKQAVVVR